MSKINKKYIGLSQLENKYKQALLVTLSWTLNGLRKSDLCNLGSKNSVRHMNKELHFIWIAAL